MNTFTSLFLTCVLLSPVFSAGFMYNQHIYNNENQKANDLRNILKSGKYCLSSDIFNKVRASDKAMKVYTEHVCSLHGNSGGSRYIASKYGYQTKLLGAGSFGKVFKYVNGNKNYAIKIPKSYAVKSLFEELHASECIKQDIGSKDKKGFGYILECVTPSGKNPHMIMDFYPTTLTDFIDKNFYIGYDLAKSNLKYKMVQMAYTLTYELNVMHKVNLAHRDFKPDNVMVNDSGKPILVDFGMTSNNFDLAKSVLGTPLYMDYELYKGNGNGQATDIYALGLIIYEMVKGANAVNKISDMIMAAGYKNYGMDVKRFNPKWSSLGCPSDFNWLYNTFKPIGTGIGTRDGRWSLEQILKKLEEMLAKETQPMSNKPTKIDYVSKYNTDEQIPIKRQAPLDVVYRQPNKINYVQNPVYKVQEKVEDVMNRYLPQHKQIKYNAPTTIKYKAPTTYIRYQAPTIRYEAPTMRFKNPQVNYVAPKVQYQNHQFGPILNHGQQQYNQNYRKMLI